jgi:hypothetical protein
VSNRSRKANLKKKDKKRKLSAIASEDEEASSRRTRSKQDTSHSYKGSIKPAPVSAKAAAMTANF